MKFLLVTEYWVDCEDWPDAMKKLSRLEDAAARSGVDVELNLSYVQNDETGDRRDAEGDEV